MRSPQVDHFHELTRRQTVFATAGVLITLLLVALDQTIVGTAMPRIVAELHGLEYYAWVTTAYLVASTALVPISGKLGDLFGRKPFILLGIVGFLAASALCGLSQDMLQLVAFRGLQGIFSGLLGANLFAVIGDLFTPTTRAKMAGLFAGTFGLASIIGPTVGGALTDGLGWRWVFYVNLPLGIVALAAIFLTLPLIKREASWRDIDFIGSVTVIGCIVPLLVALSISNTHDWTSPLMLGLLGLSAAMLAAFLWEERRAAHPIVPLGLFANRTFAISVTVVTLVSAGMFGAIIFVPLIFQGVLGLGATSSGQLFTPMMASVLLMSVITGQLMTRMRHYRFLGTGGLLVTSLGIYLLAVVTPATRELDVIVAIVLVGVGLGTTMPLYQNAVMSALPPDVMGVVTSQIQFWRSMGSTIGVAIFGSVLAHRLPENIATELTAANVPAQAAGTFASNASAQSLFDPGQLAAARAAFPPGSEGLFDRILAAVKVALAHTTHDVFLYALIVVLIAAAISAFLPEIAIRHHARPKPAEPIAA